MTRQFTLQYTEYCIKITEAKLRLKAVAHISRCFEDSSLSV